ncbi:MAG: hypothetical protein WD448_11305 [Woeseia sp.]
MPIQVFDLQAPDVSEHFRAFLSEVPMTNDRPLPAALIDDTVASLSFVKAVTAIDEPSYFVAAYIQKTPLVALGGADRQRYLQRYGEDVFPQQVCPVFLNHANATVPRLLSTAVNLPAAYFDSAQGSAENLDRLFALTEASHCGFIARELANPTVVPQGLDQREIRMILEALGDFEATAVFRSVRGPSLHADEADVLFAARLLATFLLDRENAYTAIPALLHEYERIGVNAAHRDLQRILASARLARHAVREILGASGIFGLPQNLETVRAALEKAQADQTLNLDDSLASRLVAAIGPAIQLIQGQQVASAFPGRADSPEPQADVVASPLVTLTGISTLN